MRRVALGMVVVALVGILATMALATGPGGGGGPGGGRRGGAAFNIGDMLTRNLALTDEQKTALKPLVDTYNADVTAAGTDRTARTAARDKLVKAIPDGLKLTADQKTKFDAAVRMGGQVSAAGTKITQFDRAVNSITGLDDATKAKIEQLRKDRDAKIDAAVKAMQDGLGASLTPAQKEALDKALAAPAAGGPGGMNPGGRRNRRGGTTPTPAPAT